jgi:hypothetical protein
MLYISKRFWVFFTPTNYKIWRTILLTFIIGGLDIILCRKEVLFMQL